MLYIVLATLLYSAAITVAVTAARNANTNLAALITNLTSIIIPLLIVLPKLAKKSLPSSAYGIWMAVLSGLFIGFYVLALNKAFTQNKVGIITPVIYGGAILISTVASYFLYKEKISGMEGLGLAIVLAGIIIVIYARATTT